MATKNRSSDAITLVPAFLTTEEREKMAFGMFNFWRTRLGLLAWELKFFIELTDRHKAEIVTAKKDQPNAEIWAWCETPFETEYAEIFLNPEALLKLTEKAVETTIVHELCHCNMSSIDDLVDNFSSHFLDKKLYKFVYEMEYTRHAEILIERMAMNYVSLRRQLSPDINWMDYANAEVK